jgi:hypothetical protein
VPASSQLENPIGQRASVPWWRSSKPWIAAAIAIAVRLILIFVWPPQCYSCDLSAWKTVTASALVGVNPYDKTVVLNWPPLWMEILFVLGKLSNRFDWDFFTSVRLCLTAADAILVLSTYALLDVLQIRTDKFRLVLLGICLNPLLILLTIQQGNFDVLPTIGIVWCLYSLIRFRRQGQALDWLIAAGWLGLGAFAKTFPLVLAPLLAAEPRHLPMKTRLTGLAMILAPTALSLGPLYVLNPDRIRDVVFHYRGTPGPMGMSGILQYLFGLESAFRYAPYFTIALGIALLILTALLWRRPLRDDWDVVLLAALILISLFEFGSGYCPQYWMWVTPLLVATYPRQSRPLRTTILVAGLIVIATNVLTLGYEGILGSFMVYLAPSLPWNGVFERAFSDTMHDLVLISLPMTAITLVLLIQAGAKIFQKPSPDGLNNEGT